MYYEEVDFCLRARRAGWECWYVPASRVIHLVGQASKINNPHMKPKRRPRYWFDSRAGFFSQNYGFLVSLLADAAWASGYACFRLRRLAMLKKVNDAPWLLWDFVRYTCFASRQSGRRESGIAVPPGNSSACPAAPYIHS